MPRIKPIQITESEGQSRQLLEEVQRNLGMVPNLLKTMAHSSAVLSGYLRFTQALSSALTAPLREQIALTVAGANRCDYCASAHTALGVKVGIDSDELTKNLKAESTDIQTQAALRFARAVVDNRGWVNDDDLSDVRNAGYSESQIAEIVAVVALNTFTNYFNHVAGTDIDFPKVDASKTKTATGNRD